MGRTGDQPCMNGAAPSPPEWVNLGDDERVWLRVRPSRNLVLVALTVGFALLLAMSVAVSAMSDLTTGRAVSLTVLLLIVGLILAAFLLTRRREYLLTSERVCAGIGFGNKRGESLAIEDVDDVVVEQSTWQQLANVGTLRFVGAGDELAWSLVGNPAYLQQQALQIVTLED